MNLQLQKYLFLGFVLTALNFCFLLDINSQNLYRYSHGRTGDLVQFSKERDAAWKRNYNRALQLCEEMKFPASYTDENGRIVMLQRLGYQNRPVYYATDNADAARIISTSLLWTDEDEQPYLTGEGMEVNIWDGGSILDTHREFQNSIEPRIKMRDLDVPLSNHSTHIAGTIGAAGIDELARGMAGHVSMFGWDYNNDVAEMANMASEGILVSNHSYGSICGWDYNSNLELWYWYGDPGLSASEDYQFGFYDQVSEDLDFIAWNAPDYLIVKSAGNDRNDAPPDQPLQHYIWDDGWTPVLVERPPDGGADGYDCLTPMSVSKNILTVGAVDDDKLITSFSAFGPTDDGRIKPDVVANGLDVYSSVATSFNDYGFYNGTSMAAASVTGSTALLHQLQDELLPGVVMHSSTLKGLLIHTAEEMGNGPGPDYQSGWGLLNIKASAELLKLNAGNGGLNIREEMILEGESVTIAIEVPTSLPGLKITLCWTDPPGTAIAPVLNSREAKLVNDLDLELIQVGSNQSYFPWILNPDQPDAPAAQGVNHLDNVEQILLPDAPSGSYQIKIGHSNSLSGGKQSFSLIVSGNSSSSGIFPPTHLQYLAGETSVQLKWAPPESGSPDYYKIYRNDLLLDVSTDSFYFDLNAETNQAYAYYVTSVYDAAGTEFESLGTNRITVVPRTLRSLPYVVDFEEEYDEMFIRNNQDGWLWGDSDSLSCYYLDFEENTTYFIAANSYSYGRISHINDIAATMPLKLAGCNGVSISFDYILNTGIYDAIDVLNVMYKLPGDLEWQELEQLPRAISWTSRTISLPDAACKDGTQIGFYYDDLYQWGLGAGLDNINITGVTSRSVDLAISSMSSPLSGCNLSDLESVTISIINTGSEDALPGDAIQLQMNVSPGVQSEETIVLTETLAPGQILVYTWTSTVDLSVPGSYDFDFLLLSSIDQNTANNTYHASIEVSGSIPVSILNQVLSFCEDDPPVLIEVSPAGGTLSGTGISGLYFYPEVAGVGTHTVSYFYTDLSGCSGSVSTELVVNALPLPNILNQDLSFCEDDPPVLIEVSPGGGTLSGPGVSGLNFNPAVAGVGTHLLTYTYIDPSGCQGSTSAEIVVIPLPQPFILNQDLSFCEDDPPVQIEVNPAGGTLTGPGISELYFYPEVAGVGTHLITYAYTDPSGCQGSVSAELVVNPAPTSEIITDNRRFCRNDDPLPVKVNPSGGVLTGPGINDLFFNPELAGPGVHICTYTVTDTTGCTGSDTVSLEVVENPWIDLGTDQLAGMDDTIELEPLGNGTSFLWYNGSTDKTLPIFTSELGIGEHDIWVETSNPENCKAVDSMLLTINSGTGTTTHSSPPRQFIYPNPFETGFYLKGCENEIIERIVLIGSAGQILMNEIPSTYPYFDAQDLPGGIYILNVQTRSMNLSFKLIKTQ